MENAGLISVYTTWLPPLELSLLDSSNTMISNPAFWKIGSLISGSMLFLSQLLAMPRAQS